MINTVVGCLMSTHCKWAVKNVSWSSLMSLGAKSISNLDIDLWHGKKQQMPMITTGQLTELL